MPFSSFVSWIAMFARRRQGKGWKPILFIILNLTIGLSCVIPVILFASTEAWRQRNLILLKVCAEGTPAAGAGD